MDQRLVILSQANNSTSKRLLVYWLSHTDFLQNCYDKRKSSQRKTEFGTQILICLKPSLIHVHVRNVSMVI